MVHLPYLIQDLALITTSAAIMTVLFKKLKQPIVLGYIIAGILIGPHTSLSPIIIDKVSIQIWAEIGVIFLLFSLGLEFSFKKLVKVGSTASVTAITEVITMLLAGFVTGTLLGWSIMDRIFLGGILSISSTTIIIRTLDELGVKTKKFASLVFGILVIEDLFAIILLVLLSTVAVSKQFSGAVMLYSIAKLIFFLVLWFLAGIYFLPTILRRLRSLMNDEILLVTSISLCLAMVVLATSVGFSPALGAFVMGSILAETVISEKAEHLTKSVKDLFGAVFFVSVGMLIDPKMLGAYIGPVIIIILITIFFKTASTTIGALISGQPLKQAVQAGMSLSQIGEFSFIIATLGLTLKVTSAFLYPIAVAVSAITTFTTPYMIKLSVPFYEWLDRKLPVKYKNLIERYSAGTQALKLTTDWRLVLRSHILQTLVFSIFITSLILVLSKYIVPSFLAGRDNPTALLIAAIAAGVLMLPVFWALALRPIKPEETARLVADRGHRGPLMLLQVLRIVVAVCLMIFLLNIFLPFYMTVLIVLGLTVLVILARKKLHFIYGKIERRFVVNLNEKEIQKNYEKGIHLTPWDAHIVSFLISPYYDTLGKTLEELQWREQLGINIVKIKRANVLISLPYGHERIFPGDVVYVMGTDDQIELLKAHLSLHTDSSLELVHTEHEMSLEHVLITPESALAGQTIDELSIRERTHGLVVGLERDGERYLNPESDIILKPYDLLWIVGNRRDIRHLNVHQ